MTATRILEMEPASTLNDLLDEITAGECMTDELQELKACKMLCELAVTAAGRWQVDMPPLRGSLRDIGNPSAR
jgi:hypothetical protein